MTNLKKITKDTLDIISDIYILDATDGLILSSFSPYYYDIFDSAKHYTLEDEVKNPKEFEQKLRCLFSCNIRRIEMPSGLSAEETEILLKINQDGLHNEFLRILRTRPDSLLISESIHIDEMNTNHNLKYIPQNFRSLDDLTHGLTLPRFIPHSQSIVDPPVHYTLENTVKDAKEFEQELKCSLSCKVTRTELPSGLIDSEIECLIRENQKSLLDKITDIWEFYSDTVIISEHIHVDTVSTNRNLQYIPQRFRSLEILLNALCPDVEFYEAMKLKQEAEIIESIKSYSNQRVYAIRFNTLKEFLEKKGIL